MKIIFIENFKIYKEKFESFKTVLRNCLKKINENLNFLLLWYTVYYDFLLAEACAVLSPLQIFPVWGVVPPSFHWLSR